jgi:hypothetical protein
MFSGLMRGTHDHPARRRGTRHYSAHGYTGISDCLFAMLCDLTGLYANRTRTPGTTIPRHVTLIDPEFGAGILESVANNIAPERGFADEED